MQHAACSFALVQVRVVAACVHSFAISFASYARPLQCRCLCLCSRLLVATFHVHACADTCKAWRAKHHHIITCLVQLVNPLTIDRLSSQLVSVWLMAFLIHPPSAASHHTLQRWCGVWCHPLHLDNTAFGSTLLPMFPTLCGSGGQVLAPGWGFGGWRWWLDMV
jgi:hypothetical protein